MKTKKITSQDIVTYQDGCDYCGRANLRGDVLVEHPAFDGWVFCALACVFGAEKLYSIPRQQCELAG